MGVDGLRAVIRHKNATYHALTEALLHCERWRHTHGEIPPTWAARLAELRAHYDEARAVWLSVSGTRAGAANACETVYK
jgi:hypothetical protein